MANALIGKKPDRIVYLDTDYTRSYSGLGHIIHRVYCGLGRFNPYSTSSQAIYSNISSVECCAQELRMLVSIASKDTYIARTALAWNLTMGICVSVTLGN